MAIAIQRMIIATGVTVFLVFGYLLFKLRLRQYRQDLQGILDAIPDLLFETGLDGRCYGFYSTHTDLLVAPAANFIGRTVSEVLPADAAITYMEALREALETGFSTGRQYSLELPQGRHWFELSISRKYKNSVKEPRFIVLSRDITERKNAEEGMRRMAHYDSLTGLPNRTTLDDRISTALASATRSDSTFAVLFLDLDHFKDINDTYGHHVGDEVLIGCAERMKATVRQQDTVSRFGGDEFLLLLPDTDAVGSAHVAEKLLSAVTQSHYIGPLELSVTPSIGIAMYPSDGSSLDELIRCADIAMYRAKREGRNNYRFYSSTMQARSVRAAGIDHALSQAMTRNEFHPHYQPQISLRDGRIFGVEALLRWRHPEQRTVAG